MRISRSNSDTRVARAIGFRNGGGAGNSRGAATSERYQRVRSRATFVHIVGYEAAARRPRFRYLRAVTLDPKRYPILVVDDEQDNLDAFRFNFRKSHDILSATSGAEALQVLEQSDVAVIVTDQRMPKMTGLELLREARQLRPDAVGIILTAFTDVDVLIDAINLGQIYRYITKPWDAKEIRGVLQY